MKQFTIDSIIVTRPSKERITKEEATELVALAKQHNCLIRFADAYAGVDFIGPAFDPEHLVTDETPSTGPYARTEAFAKEERQIARDYADYRRIPLPEAEAAVEAAVRTLFQSTTKLASPKQQAMLRYLVFQGNLMDLAALLEGPVRYVYGGVMDATGCKVADIRGWGYLIGQGAGGLGLTDKTATAMQREMGELIASWVSSNVRGHRHSGGVSKRTSYRQMRYGQFKAAVGALALEVRIPLLVIDHDNDKDIYFLEEDCDDVITDPVSILHAIEKQVDRGWYDDCAENYDRPDDDTPLFVYKGEREFHRLMDVNQDGTFVTEPAV